LIGGVFVIGRKVALSGLIYLVLEVAYTDIGEGGPVLLPLGIPTG